MEASSARVTATSRRIAASEGKVLAAPIRSRAADRLRHPGVAVDAARNAAAGDGDDISTSEARVRTFVVTAREDLEIARGVHSVLGDQSASAQPSVVAGP